MKKIWIIIGTVILILIILLVLFLHPKQAVKAPTIEENSKQSVETGTPVPSELIIECLDLACFQPQFLNCYPSEMKKLVSQNVNYVVNVYGIENNKCHLSYKFIDQNEKLIANKKNLDCYVPLNNINLDMFDYLFTINQKDDNLISNQQKIETDYCNKL